MIHSSKQKLFWLLLCTSIWWGACTEGTKQPNAGPDSAVQNTVAASVDTLPYRERLIQALQQLQRDITNKNKEAIAGYFPFPLPSDALQAYDVNEAFDKAIQQNHQVSRQLFLEHFDALYLNLEMQGITDIFKNLSLDSLKNTTTQLLETSKPQNICTHYYSISIEGREVTLNYGVNTNDQYLSQHADEPSECPEYAAFWTFSFDGKQLVFARHQVAG